MLIPRHPIVNPVIPFVDKFSNALRPGTMIMITASISRSVNRFSINLALGDNFQERPGRSPIALHFNPRFSGSYTTVRNSFQNGWEREETASPNSHFPFHEGQNFEIMILVSPDDYMIAVDGKHYINFTHRIPYQQVTTLQVLEEINVKRIMVIEGPYSPPIATRKPEPEGNIAYDLAVPFETEIPGTRIRKGSTIHLSGRPNPAANKFNIDLFVGVEYGIPVDVAFHISVRFLERVVVRNTKSSGLWGREERDLFPFVFQQNTIFDMKIVCEVAKFDVFVDGQYICSYRHRLPYSQIDRFRVEGDVFVRSLMFR